MKASKALQCYMIVCPWIWINAVSKQIYQPDCSLTISSRYITYSTGAGIYVNTGDDTVPTGVLPNNSIVIARTAGTRIAWQCRSGSTMTGVGQLVALDGNTFNTGQSTGVFSIASIGNPVQPGSVLFRNHANNEPALTTADEGVYSCRIPDETGNEVDVNIGVYKNGFNSKFYVFILISQVMV